ncbi:MAG TPA: PD-(D/E)XK nuclease family protein, partial [Ohtaekwangia sp.]
MKTFIQDIAETIRQQYTDWENLTVIFPNRRAALYFRKALAENLDTPRWSPAILSVEEFIGSYSDLKEADKLSLIVVLYRVFKRVTHSEENLDHFYFWGEMLLRDFDELDKYLVNANGLFKDLSNQKELDQYFDYLTEEQKEFLVAFWQTIDFSSSASKQKFLELWQSLYPVYIAFRQQLMEEKIGYSGMIHRHVAEHIDKLIPAGKNAGMKYIFAGFNALTAAEEKIMTWFVEHHDARIFWDEDAFYVNEPHREAGTFLRQYRKHTVLGRTFTPDPAIYLGQEKKITILGVPQKAGQPKLLAQQLEATLRVLADKGIAERTVIVLPDENMLLPVLYALPPSLQSINVTMGFPLVSTPFYSLIDFLFDLHLHIRKGEFYYRHVLALLNHPYIKARVGEDAAQWRAFIQKNNQVHISPSFFEKKHDLLDVIFRIVPVENFLAYLLEVVEQIATDSSTNGLMEKEFAFNFHRILARVQELTTSEPMELRMQQRMFRQVVRAEKVPFTGEPLKGIQIMGV